MDCSHASLFDVDVASGEEEEAAGAASVPAAAAFETVAAGDYRDVESFLHDHREGDSDEEVVDSFHHPYCLCPEGAADDGGDHHLYLLLLSLDYYCLDGHGEAASEVHCYCCFDEASLALVDVETAAADP